MCPERLQSQRGFGLLAAIFVIVVLAAFGLLIARYTATGALSSAEDYVWAQSLYAADSAARLHLLHADGGGDWPGGLEYPRVGRCTTTEVDAGFNDTTRTGMVEVRAGAGEVTRTIIVTYRL
jgi:hypothetical protein